RGYRSGGHNIRGNTTQASFATFSPEAVIEYEIGAKSVWLDHRLRLNVAAFYDDYTNIQRSVIIAAPNGAPVTVITNAASAKVKGVEVEAEFRPIQQLTLSAAYGLVDAKY